VFSFVIPLYNEEENIEGLYSELLIVIKRINIDYEIIFINDGSFDKTLDLIKTIANRNNNVKYISFIENMGQSAALGAGFHYAQGESIITMDGDLQNNPEDIIEMLKYYGTYDMVTGWRQKRMDSLWKKIGSKLGNTFRNILTKENIHDTGCSLKIMRADILKRIKMFKGLHRFLPTLMKLEGAKIKEIKVDHRPRTKGISKYNNLHRAKEGFFDVLAVRWMIKRYIKYKIEDKNV
jgi:dolichol-phosphate mannosyltransferase